MLRSAYTICLYLQGGILYVGFELVMGWMCRYVNETQNIPLICCNTAMPCPSELLPLIRGSAPHQFFLIESYKLIGVCFRQVQKGLGKSG